MYNLGAMYYNGDGVSKNLTEAARWYELAAAQGNVEAQFNLGVMFYNGEGISKNDNIAAKWYRLAAEQGYADAQYNLGFLYSVGHGVPQDSAYALMWVNIAAYNSEFNDFAEARNYLTGSMSRQDIETAQKLTRNCIQKQFKEC